MTDNTLILVAAALLSLLFEYVPGFAGWFQPLSSVEKRLLMAGLLLLSALGVFLAACYSPWQWVTCGEAGFWELVQLFVLAVIANQGTHRIAKRG